MLRVVLLALLMLPTSLQAQAREIPYSKINPLLSIETQSPLIEKTLSVELTDTALSYEDVNVWLTKEGEIISPISVDAVDGRIQLTALTEQEAQRHTLRINQPKESANINLQLKVLSPPSTSMRYQDIFHLVNDANLLIKTMAGTMAFFAPKVDTLKFHFAEPATVSISAEAAPLEYETEPDTSMGEGFQSVSIKQSKHLMEVNPLVVFSVIPESIEPLD